VDPQIAERATSRRGWLGAAGAAGLLGAAAVLLSDGPAKAAPPTSPTDADKELLAAAQSLELAARDLYQLAIDAGIDDPDGSIAVIARNHRAYAESIAGMTGVSANSPSQEVYDALESGFDTTDVQQFAAAAQQLENDAVATHTELLAQYESLQAKRLTASILVVEARQATVLGDVLGDDVDALLEASGTAASTPAASADAEGDA
jgi:hypothetical protein